MITPEQIQKLKDNEKPYGIMMKEPWFQYDVQIFMEQKSHEFLYYRRDWEPKEVNTQFHLSKTYKLKDSFQLEEKKELKLRKFRVVEKNLSKSEVVKIVVLYDTVPDTQIEMSLTYAQSHKDFLGFIFEEEFDITNLEKICMKISNDFRKVVMDVENNEIEITFAKWVILLDRE